MKNRQADGFSLIARPAASNTFILLPLHPVGGRRLGFMPEGRVNRFTSRPTLLSHPWRSSGQKRTIVWEQTTAPEQIATCLWDMQDAIRYALQVAYRDAVSGGTERMIPSPIQLRREIRDWFYSRYDYARHHINPVCRTAVAMLRSYRKNHRGELGIPEVKRLAMRIDGELFRLLGDTVRLTLSQEVRLAHPQREERSLRRVCKG
ncbi:MAG: hypothetical protein JRN06_08070 [Nitrososphaerota archaeon]|nr:hypothetical protein [Nitrososphaerota archaeon]MDG7024262.1 hypothetical protein [Nitrososphaerota archaeon]